MNVELWFFADWIGLTPGKHTSVSKVVDIPFLPRKGDAVIIGDQLDTSVSEVCFDFVDNVISVSLDTAGVDQEDIDWLIANDGWKYDD